jgi:hypothetical protein
MLPTLLFVLARRRAALGIAGIVSVATAGAIAFDLGGRAGRAIATAT